MNELPLPLLLVIAAAAGYLFRCGTSFSVAEYNQMVERFRQIGDLHKQVISQKNDLIADQLKELRRLSYELSDVTRERDAACHLVTKL